MFIAYLEAYIHFRNYGGTSLDVVPNLVRQQVLCGYSLITATTPCLKGLLKRFRTEMAAINEIASYSRTYVIKTPDRAQLHEVTPWSRSTGTVSGNDHPNMSGTHSPAVLQKLTPRLHMLKPKGITAMRV